MQKGDANCGLRIADCGLNPIHACKLSNTKQGLSQDNRRYFQWTFLMVFIMLGRLFNASGQVGKWASGQGNR